MAVVWVNAYTGCVTSFIMSPTSVVFADSAKDIAALAPSPILMTDKFSGNEASFLVSLLNHLVYFLYKKGA